MYCEVTVWLLLILLTISFRNCKTNECSPRNYNHGTVVCVCNATYCDTVDPVQPIPSGKYILYTSNKAGLRFKKIEGSFSQNKDPHAAIAITLNPDRKYQQIFGWGGAFTDAAGYNIQKLNNDAKENLLKSYFSNEGIEYSLCRVPIGCSDFSLNYYSYDETPGDINLTQFNLTREDFDYKIPFMKEALKLSNNKLKFFGSTWTPPVWMKTNNKPSGFGFLKKEYYQTWADYHIKFLDEYKKLGIDFWGLTTGNEPMLGVTPFFDITSLGWMPWDQGKWLEENLGPTLKNNSNYSNTKIIALDDQRLTVPFWLILMTIRNKAMDYIDGIGIHWYSDPFFPFLLSFTRYLYPTKFLLGTEACTGDRRYREKVVLGNWRRGEEYLDDIIEDLEYWFTGWVEWNLALNLKGGPTYISNFVDSSIIVNATAQEFYKQPTYYTFGHFTKFVPTDSYRIYTETTARSLKVIGFTRPDNGTALIIYNRHSNNNTITIYDDKHGYINLIISPRSVNTILYW